MVCSNRLRTNAVVVQPEVEQAKGSEPIQVRIPPDYNRSPFFRFEPI